MLLVSMHEDVGTMFGAVLLICGFPAVHTLQNLALGKQAYQPDAIHGGVANLAVDGNKNTNYAAGSCTHTDMNFPTYWKVDLGKVYILENVVVYGRTDCNCYNCCSCCANRLRDVQLYIGTTEYDYELRGFHSGVMQPGDIFHLTSPAYGRWVKITRLPSVLEALTLCEVEVMGTEIQSTVRFMHFHGTIGTVGILGSSPARTRAECCLRCKMTDTCVAVNYNVVTEECQTLETAATSEDLNGNNDFFRLR